MTRRPWMAAGLIGVALGLVFWTIDAELATYVFGAGTLLENLLDPGPVQWGVRVLVLLLCAAASLAAVAFWELRLGREKETALVRRIEALYQHTTEAIIGFDRDLKVLFANVAAEEFAGATAADLEGLSCDELSGMSSLLCDGCLAAETLSDAATRSRNVSAPGNGGEVRWFEQSWRPLVGSDGEVEAIIEVVRDITRLKSYEFEVAQRQQAQAELSAERDLTQRYLDETTAIMLALDLDGRVTMANRRASDVFGFPLERILGADWVNTFVPPDGQSEFLEHFDRLRSGAAGEASAESEVYTLLGDRRLVRWGDSPLYDERGVVSGVLRSGEDVTDQRRAEEEAAFKSFVLDKTTDQVIVHRLDGTVVYANEAAYASRGYTEEEFYSLAPFGWVPLEVREVGKRAGDRLSQEGAVIYESALRDEVGHLVPIEVHTRTMEVNDELLVVSVGRDISERKEAEAKIHRMAFYDQVTGLPNRALFIDRLRVALGTSARTGNPLAVMFLDLDHFKHVNDTLGHSVGDELLQAVASRLSTMVRQGDTLARLGGDEFTFVIVDVGDESGAEAAASRMIEAFREPFDVAGRPLSCAASIGVLVGTGEELQVEEALCRADAAMYRAKEEGRNRFRVYRDVMGAAVGERFDIRERLQVALAEEEFRLYYQPQVAAADGRIIGVEALIRWDHPERGLLAPSEFLPLAEESGLMQRMGEWAIRDACARLTEWEEHGFDLRLAVNVSPREVTDPALLPLLEAVVVETGIEPHRLEIEVTETTALSDPSHLRTVLENVRALGIGVVIDDFGTGFSSLDHLRRLPVDAVKIDRGFVAEIEDNPDAAIITNTVVVLAHGLGLRVVAEGVETVVQRDFLRERGCDAMQGYLFSEPLPASRVLGVLEEGVCFGA